MHSQNLPTYGESLEALRNYVTGGQEPQYHAPEGQVRLAITHSVLPGSMGNTRNYSLTASIADLKSKLQMIVGTSPSFMRLQLIDKDGSVVANMDNNQATLAQYHPRDGMGVHVIDTDPSATIASLQDTSQVEKYTMSEEEYNKRQGTYRKFKEQQKQQEQPQQNETEEPAPEHIHVGDRCAVDSEDGSMERRGTVRFVGNVHFASGYWIGIQFDAPLGKNDGSFQGKRYFTAPPKYGGFVKPNKVKVGDYPEEDFDEI